MTRLCLITLFALGAALPAQAALFQPDSATASSEFSGSYDIGNAIDGSGLPANFGPTDAHDTYAVNNHWTTRANQVPGASANFQFDSEVTIGTFYLWNHRSNGIAANQYYEVTEFDLILRDGANGILHQLPGLKADGETDTAQTYAFTPVSGVRSVEFIVQSNQGFEQQIGTNYTGVAEVAFSELGVPEPASAALIALAAGALGIRRRG